MRSIKLLLFWKCSWGQQRQWGGMRENMVCYISQNHFSMEGRWIRFSPMTDSQESFPSKGMLWEGYYCCLYVDVKFFSKHNTYYFLYYLQSLYKDGVIFKLLWPKSTLPDFNFYILCMEEYFLDYCSKDYHNQKPIFV